MNVITNLLVSLVLSTQLTLTGHLHEGLKALDAKKYDAAIASLTQVVDDKDPGNSYREVALHFRAEAYRGKDDKEKALSDWTTLLKQTRNAQVRELALTGYKELGGDPKKLMPAESPTAVWEKFLAAAQKADVDAALAISTGMWRELVMKETKGNGVKLQREFGREKFFVLSERVGEKDEAGKAWLEIGDDRGRAQVVLELTLDPQVNAWLISSFRENRHGSDFGTARGVENMNRLKQIGLALHWWAADNENKYPDKLETVTPNYLNDAQALSWTHPKTGKQSPFLYCAGLPVDDGAAKVFVAAPEAVDGQREVLFGDASVRTVKEDEFLRLAKAQKWNVPGTAKKEDLTKEKQEEVRQLVKQLGHDEAKVRKEARNKLQAMGDAINPVLGQYRNATDPEIRAIVLELLGEKQ